MNLATAEIAPVRSAEIATAPEPPGPYLDPILALHRGHDALLTLHRKVSGDWENLGAVRASEFASIFPAFRAELDRDSYFSINGFAKAKRRNSPLGFPLPNREAANVQYLCACYADLDCYNDGLDFAEAVAQVFRRVEAGTIPEPSILSRSGRGCWLFWVLRRDDDSSKPPQVEYGSVSLYCDIQRTLGDRLQGVGPDLQAHDVSRVCRVPGSLHSGAGRRAQYWIAKDAACQPLTYTLTELRKFLQIEDEFAPELPPVLGGITVSVEPPAVTEGCEIRPNGVQDGRRGQRGWRALNESRLKQLLLLEKFRKGFSKGCRSSAAFLFALFLRKNGYDEGSIYNRLLQFGKSCHPPLTQAASQSAARSGIRQICRARKGHNCFRLRYDTISDWLKITPDEASQLRVCLKKTWKSWGPAACFQPRPPTPRTLRPRKHDKIRVRRERILELIGEQGGKIPSVRQMSCLLAGRYGIEARHVIVSYDYRSLGLTSTWRQGVERKKRTADAQVGLPFAGDVQHAYPSNCSLLSVKRKGGEGVRGLRLYA